MKKPIVLFCITLWVCSLAAAQQKYALVIGNGGYSNFGALKNPINDANDMEAALKSLGWTVEKILNGSLDLMENAVMRLKNRLSVSPNAYGFFFYAGHGVQSNGENYLIPVDANISSESLLRQRAMAVGFALDELNNAGNTLNVVILDACRDFPASWSRSGNRGLSVVSNQPADSIIVYATSAGSTASDGDGRNGLFTSQLLNNLKTPGIEVTEVFRRTMGDVLRASGNKQRPAVYNQFPGIAYLGSAGGQPAPAPAPKPAPAPAPAPQNTTQAETFFKQGLEAFNKGNYDQAIRDYTEAIRLNPQLVNAYYNRGLAYANGKRDYDQAIRDYTEAIRLNPQFANAYNNRGIAYQNGKKDYDQSIRDYTEAIRFNPQFALAYYNRGNVYMNGKRDYDQAIRDYTEAIRLNPQYVDAYNNRGIAYMNGKKDYDQAIRDYTEAIRLNPQYALAYYNCGNAYMNGKKNYDQAIRDYTEAIRLNPQYVDAYYNRGNAYRDGKKDYDQAIRDYTEAIRLNPQYVAAYHNRGDAYRVKGQYDAAIKDCNEAIRLDPNYALSFATRGVAYNQTGRKDQAIKDLEKSVSLNPNNEWAKARLKEIRGW